MVNRHQKLHSQEGAYCTDAFAYEDRTNMRRKIKLN
jgi:hypothetical protein